MMSAHVEFNFIKLLLEHIVVLKKRSNVLSGIIILLYTGSASDGVASPLLVLSDDPPAMLLLFLSTLISFSSAAGVEMANDSSAQFEFGAGEAPSTLGALRAVERVLPSSEFRRGGRRVVAERALSGSAASGEELALERVCFLTLVGAGDFPLLASPKSLA